MRISFALFILIGEMNSFGGKKADVNLTLKGTFFGRIGSSVCGREDKEIMRSEITDTLNWNRIRSASYRATDGAQRT